MIIVGNRRFSIRSFFKNYQKSQKTLIPFCRFVGFWGAVPGGFLGGIPGRPPGAPIATNHADNCQWSGKVWKRLAAPRRVLEDMVQGSRNYMRCWATYVIPGSKNRPKLPLRHPPRNQGLIFPKTGTIILVLLLTKVFFLKMI